MDSNRLVLNISSKYKTELVPQLDVNNYFQLSLSECSRRELFNFALALGYKRGYPSDMEKQTSFIRKEALGNDRYLYSSVFYKEVIANDLSKIDAIVDENAVFSVAEEYVNTGFSVLKDYMKEMSDENLMYKLLAEIDEIYKDFEEDMKEAKMC